MAKRAKSKAPKIDPYIDGLMAKLLERLVSLEKKMDAVVSHTSPKSIPQAQPPQLPRHDRPMYEAVCADCSKVCEVPFKPSEDRAVYCKTCWAQRKQNGGGPARKGAPFFKPVALPPKPVSKLSAAAHMAAEAKKSKPAKKTKKKK